MALFKRRQAYVFSCRPLYRDSLSIDILSTAKTARVWTTQTPSSPIIMVLLCNYFTDSHAGRLRQRSRFQIQCPGCGWEERVLLVFTKLACPLTCFDYLNLVHRYHSWKYRRDVAPSFHTLEWGIT